MRSVLKVCDLEDRFPILAVENNCIVSKDADITVAFEVGGRIRSHSRYLGKGHEGASQLFCRVQAGLGAT